MKLRITKTNWPYWLFGWAIISYIALYNIIVSNSTPVSSDWLLTLFIFLGPGCAAISSVAIAIRAVFRAFSSAKAELNPSERNRKYIMTFIWIVIGIPAMLTWLTLISFAMGMLQLGIDQSRYA